MAFLNRLYTVLPGFGSPIQNDTQLLKQNVALSTTGQQTNSLTSISPTFSRGYVRVKLFAAGGTSPTLLQLIVNVTDGTTFVSIGFFAPVVAIAPAFSLVPGGTVIGGSNGSITSGAAILTSVSNPFTPAMVGQAISVTTAGAGATILYTTILSYQSAGQVTLAANAGATATVGVMTLTSNYSNGGSNTALGGIDFLIPFEVDIAASQVSVLTTLGGTSPTAQMDVEVSATI